MPTGRIQAPEKEDARAGQSGTRELPSEGATDVARGYSGGEWRARAQARGLHLGGRGVRGRGGAWHRRGPGGACDGRRRGRLPQVATLALLHRPAVLRGLVPLARTHLAEGQHGQSVGHRNFWLGVVLARADGLDAAQRLPGPPAGALALALLPAHPRRHAARGPERGHLAAARHPAGGRPGPPEDDRALQRRCGLRCLQPDGALGTPQPHRHVRRYLCPAGDAPGQPHHALEQEQALPLALIADPAPAGRRPGRCAVRRRHREPSHDCAHGALGRIPHGPDDGHPRGPPPGRRPWLRWPPAGAAEAVGEPSVGLLEAHPGLVRAGPDSGACRGVCGFLGCLAHAVATQGPSGPHSLVLGQASEQLDPLWRHGLALRALCRSGVHGEVVRAEVDHG
mmetsp:Transcript_91655/g.255276  ORF Transcript_91655/g.255276 Transcript_91655/m.255276 type:complete len:396 (-) Transcript_91655:100-1287(-)